MSIKLGDNIEMTGPVPNDARYLNVNVPWTGTTEVNTALLGGTGGVRYTGLTVNVDGIEYWYKDGIADIDLVEKTSGGGGAGLLNWTGSTANALGTYMSVSGICAQPNLTFDGSVLNLNGNLIVSGDTGFGTDNPARRVHIYDGNSSGTSYSGANLLIENDGAAFINLMSPNADVQGIMFGDPEDNNAGYLRYSHADDSMKLYTDGSPHLCVDVIGNVSTDGCFIGDGSQLTNLPSSGDVSKVGTPAICQVAVWTGDGTVCGGDNLKMSSNQLCISSFLCTTASIYAGGNVLLDSNNSLILDGNEDGFVRITADYTDSFGWGANTFVLGSAGGAFVFTEGETNLLDNICANNITGSTFYGSGAGLTNLPSSGDVSKVGTPAICQVAVWTGDGTVCGGTTLKMTSNQLCVNGSVFASTNITTNTVNSDTVRVPSGHGCVILDSDEDGFAHIMSDFTGSYRGWGICTFILGSAGGAFVFTNGEENLLNDICANNITGSTFYGSAAGLTDITATNADCLGGQLAANYLRSDTSDTMSGTLTITGDVCGSGTGTIASGIGNGSVGLTINDSQGNANVTFNHIDGVADIAGNVGRITVNTDSTSGADMGFELKSNAVTGAVTSIEYMLLSESGLDVTGCVNASTCFVGSGAGLTGTAASLTAGNATTANNATCLGGQVAGYYARCTVDNTFTGKLSLAHSVASEATLKVLRTIDDASATPSLIVTGDGEATDILAEFRSNASGVSVDTADAGNSTDSKFQVFGTGIVCACLCFKAPTLCSTGNVYGTCFCGKAYDSDRLDNYSSGSFLRSDAADIKTSGNLIFNDNICAAFGTGSDLIMVHDGVNGYINNTGTGNLYIRDADVNSIYVSSTCSMLYNTGVVRLRTCTSGTKTEGVHCSSTCGRSPVHCSTTCAASPLVCATTRAQSPIVCGSTCVRGAYILSMGTVCALTWMRSACLHSDGTICAAGSTGVRFAASVGCGSAIDWIATSDCRIKKCIKPITSALSTVDALCGVCYELCEGGNKDMGLIAQEVEKVEPRLVTHQEVSEEYKKYGIEDNMLGLKYDKFAGLFVESIKELKNQNSNQQLQIEELKEEIKILKDEKSI